MSDDKAPFTVGLPFSQRYGYEKPIPIRLEEISDDLRRKIWDVVSGLFTRGRHINAYNAYKVEYFAGREGEFFKRVLGEFLKKPRDKISTICSRVEALFKETIWEGKFNRVLEFIEIIVNDPYIGIEFIEEIENLFEQYAAYRLGKSQRPYEFFPCASKEQCDSVQQALETIHRSGMVGAAEHLRKASIHLNENQYGDAMVHSIHAVESVACQINLNANKALGPALDSLEEAGLLTHPALKEAFKKLYGYASDERGLRHSLLDTGTPNVGLDEALFMFGACASFVAYLVNKSQKIQQSEMGNQ